MTTHERSGAAAPQLAAKGAILLAFIVALEIVIMISPFALFFYAVFNPSCWPSTTPPRRAGSRPSSCSV